MEGNECDLLWREQDLDSKGESLFVGCSAGDRAEDAEGVR